MQIERNKPKTGWRPLTYILFSPPKVGKSTLLSQFSPKGIDDVLILDTESGTDELDCNRIKIANLAELKNGFREAYNSDFGTIGIDVVDPIYEWVCTDLVNSRNKGHSGYDKIQHISEIPQGAGWSIARTNFMNHLSPIKHLKSKGKSVVLVAHMKSPNDQVGFQKVRTIDLPGSLSRVIAGDVDIIGLLSVERLTKKRMITFAPYDLVDAGSRSLELADKTFELPKDDPFKYIREAFEGKEIPDNKFAEIAENVN